MSNITMKRLVAVIYVLVAGCMWGCMGVLVRMMGKINLTSMEIVFLRSAVTLIAMIIFLLVKGRGCFYVKIKDLWCFVGTGAFSIAFFNYCYFFDICSSGFNEMGNNVSGVGSNVYAKFFYSRVCSGCI